MKGRVSILTHSRFSFGHDEYDSLGIMFFLYVTLKAFSRGFLWGFGLSLGRKLVLVTRVLHTVDRRELVGCKWILVSITHE